MKKYSKILTAGLACLLLTGTMPVYVTVTVPVTTEADVTPIATAPKPAYENISVSQVTGHVNVRTEPNTSRSVGVKIYNNGAATMD